MNRDADTKSDQGRKSRSQDPIVELRGVEKTYDGQTNVVTELDLSVRSGEFLTLLGPSGSGKTSTLMMIAGFEMPTAGDIILRGRSVRDVPAYKRNIGVVFQNYALFPHLSVRQNIRYPLARRGVARADAANQVLRALELVKLEGLGERRPSELSGGQQQRVALARALVFDPDVVLLDEPLGALDKRLRELMQIELKRLHSMLGTTFVYVTHDQGEALTMSDRIAVFNQGRLQQIGSPSDLYEHPSNLFVANFIGDNNSIVACVKGLDGDRCVAATAHGILLSARPGGRFADGEQVRISVRPERILIGSASQSCANRLTGMLVESAYHGDYFRLLVKVEQNNIFVAQIPVNDVGSLPQTGEQLDLGWHSQHSLALPDR